MSDLAQAEEMDVAPKEYDLTTHEAWQATKRNHDEVFAELQQCLKEIERLQYKLHQLPQDGTEEEGSPIQRLKDRLSELQKKASTLQNDCDDAEVELGMETEEAKREVASVFRKQWRRLHAEWIHTVRRLQELDEALTAMERVRRRVRNRTPSCRPGGSDRVKEWDPLQPPHPPYKGTLRDVLHPGRIERLEKWADRHGYS